MAALPTFYRFGGSAETFGFGVGGKKRNSTEWGAVARSSDSQIGKERSSNKCAVAFVRSTRRGSSSQKVPHTYLAIMAVSTIEESRMRGNPGPGE